MVEKTVEEFLSEIRKKLNEDPTLTVRLYNLAEPNYNFIKKMFERKYDTRGEIIFSFDGFNSSKNYTLYIKNKRSENA